MPNYNLPARSAPITDTHPVHVFSDRLTRRFERDIGEPACATARSRRRWCEWARPRTYCPPRVAPRLTGLGTDHRHPPIGRARFDPRQGSDCL